MTETDFPFPVFLSDAALLHLTTDSNPVKVTFLKARAARDTLGYYCVDDDGVLKDPRLIFPDTHAGTLTSGVSSAFLGNRPAGKTLGFFLIEDGFSRNAAAEWFTDASLNRGGTFRFVDLPDTPFDSLKMRDGDVVFCSKSGIVKAKDATVDSVKPLLLWVKNDGTVCVASGAVWHGYPSVWGTALNPSDAYFGSVETDIDSAGAVFSLKSKDEGGSPLISVRLNAGADNFYGLIENRVGTFVKSGLDKSTTVESVEIRADVPLFFDFPLCAKKILTVRQKQDGVLKISGDMSSLQCDAVLMRARLAPSDEEKKCPVTVVFQTSRGQIERVGTVRETPSKDGQKPLLLSAVKETARDAELPSFLTDLPVMAEPSPADDSLPSFLFEPVAAETAEEPAARPPASKPFFSLPLGKKNTPVEEPKTVLVTGGAKRIGRAIALKAAAQGYNVVVHCCDSLTEASHLVEEIRDVHAVKSAYLRADLTNEEQTVGLIDGAAQLFGGLDALVNNAAVFVRDDADGCSAQTWAQNMTVNLRAPFLLMQEFARRLEKNKTGAIVNMLDERVLNLTPYFTSYTLSKAGLATLTQTLALAFAPKIRVNAVAPADVLPAAGQAKYEFDRRVAATPLGTPIEVENVADAVLFLLKAPHTTGTVLPVDAGRALNWAPEKKE